MESAPTHGVVLLLALCPPCLGGLIFIFIGDGPRKEAVKLRQLTNVFFKPYQPRKKLWQSLSVPDIHLISLTPSMEGLIVPSKFYGVCAAAKPTLFIGDKQGEIASVLAEAQCGTSVEIGDVDGLVNTVLNYKNNPDSCIEEGKRARATFDSRYEKQVALKKWSTLLEAVISKS